MKGIDPDRIPEDFHPMYKDLILWVHDTLYKLEKTAFYDGFYKAIGFGAYPASTASTAWPRSRPAWWTGA